MDKQDLAEFILGHNPCFSGQCFAITKMIESSYPKRKCHNPCFSGQCFAIMFDRETFEMCVGHNPCFSGQCFAIQRIQGEDNKHKVTILVLVDSVLQYKI